MASKRGLRRRQCGNKQALSKEEAIQRASAMGRAKPGQSFDAYRCSHCGGAWHVGHRSNIVRREISRRRVA